MVRRLWINVIWIIVGQGPIALVVGAGGVDWTFFFQLSYHFNVFLPPETARYRLK